MKLYFTPSIDILYYQWFILLELGSEFRGNQSSCNFHTDSDVAMKQFISIKDFRQFCSFPIDIEKNENIYVSLKDYDI